MNKAKAIKGRASELRTGKNGNVANCPHNDLIYLSLQLEIEWRYNEHTNTIEPDA